jgi:TonB family protein
MAITPEPVFLVRLEPWRLVFFRNFTDLFTRSTQDATESSPPGVFWTDVFVREHVPWNKFLQSLIFHTVAVVALSGIPRVLPRRVPLTESSAFNRADVIYYSPSEYLPPLNTGGKDTRRYPQKPDPEYAPQPIISVPREPDNRRQTIVTAPGVKLERDLPLPNIVAWSQVQPAVPLGATADASDRRAPMMPVPVVSPTPELTGASSRQLSALPRSIVAPPPEANAISARTLQGPQPTVVEPTPKVEVTSMRSGDVNIGHSEVVSPAPALPVAEQLSLRAMAPGSSVATAAVVPPAPSLSGATSSGSGRLIALGIRPAALAQSVEVPSGNRRGSFAATPLGRKGGSGSPGSTVKDSHGGDVLSGKGREGLPVGLLVEQGPTPASNPGNGSPASIASPSEPTHSAKLTLPTVTDAKSHPAAKVTDEKATDLDRRVFGARKFYSMTLNMPNLNSAGGSWVIRFAELKENENKGDLSAPVATQKVDPPYPTELMRHNVQGTVTLLAVIRSDGSVGDVRVLRGVDDRLDEYAREALLQWHFLPALKNGSAVDLEAVVIIPFRPLRMRF